MITLSCCNCGKLFEVIPYRAKTAKTCSKKCFALSMKNNKFAEGCIPWNKKEKIKKLCPVCNKIFYIQQSRQHIRICCSLKCSYEFKKGHTPWNKGKKFPHLTGKNAYNWKGGKTKTIFGYIWIRYPEHPFSYNGYISEHRVLVEQQIGRYLTPSETTHHLNEIKDDNRLQNLMCFINKSAHIRFHINPLNVKPEEIIFDGRNLPK